MVRMTSLAARREGRDLEIGTSRAKREFYVLELCSPMP